MSSSPSCSETDVGSEAKLERSEEEAKEDDHQEYLKKYSPEFLGTIKMCIKETNLKCVDVGNLGLHTKEITDILSLLPNSQVTECDFESSDLRSGIPHLIAALANSKLKKLSLKKCKLRVMYILALMNALNSIEITDLDLSHISFPVLCSKKSEQEFAYYVTTSSLTHLRLTSCSLVSPQTCKYLANYLNYCDITHLWLEDSGFRNNKEALELLFVNMWKQSMKELHLGRNEIEDDDLKPLCESLASCWKLEVLDLRSNKITDKGISCLFEALVSGVCSLREFIVTDNKSFNANHLYKYLKKSKTSVLYLGGNEIKKCESFLFSDFLKDSPLSELHLGHCNLGDEVTKNIVKCLKSSKENMQSINLSGNHIGIATISEFLSCLKETKINEFDFSETYLSAEALEVLGEGMKGSKIQWLIVSLRGRSGKLQQGSSAVKFIEKTIKAPLKKLDLSYTNFENFSVNLGSALKYSSLVNLNLSSCQLGTGVDDLASALKHTMIKDLNLSENDIEDDSARILGESILESKVSKLDLKKNLISDFGAIALAISLQSGPLYELNMEQNKITDEGFESLADLLKGSFISNVNVSFNAGCKTLPLVTVLWRNRVRAHKLTQLYNIIAPKLIGYEICCSSNLGMSSIYDFDDVSFNTFVEKSLLFYNAVINYPSSISALAENGAFSRDEIAGWVEEFPFTLLSFIQEKDEYDIAQHVKFLELAEKFKLSKVVESFLYHFVGMIIDDKLTNCSLDKPIVYKLLQKYEKPIYDLELKPEDRQKVEQFFMHVTSTCITNNT